MKSLTAFLLLLTPLTSLSQATGSSPATTTDSPKVSVTSRGNDVRLILTNMFAQAKKSFVLQPNIEYTLFLSLQDTDFQKALDLICSQAGLKYDFRDGIYHIYRKKPAVTTAPVQPATQTPTDPSTSSANAQVIVPKKPGKLPLSVFKKRVTTKLSKAPIGAVLEELGTQAGISIELGDNVPAYRLDAVLNNTTLKFALEQVTRAARLTYKLTDHHTILVDVR
jgi:hypothetical protein